MKLNFFFSINNKNFLLNLTDISRPAAEKARTAKIEWMTDPTPHLPSLQEAMRNGTHLCHPDALLYVSTVDGGSSLRDVMIPCLIEAMREMSVTADMNEACQQANAKVGKQLEMLDPNNRVRQLPKCESTLKSRLCIGKEFPPLRAAD